MRAEFFCLTCNVGLRDNGNNTYENEKRCRRCGNVALKLNTGDLPKFYRLD